MENDRYQKDFKPFLIWLIVFMIGMNGFPMLVKMFPSMTSAMQTKLSIFLLLVALLILYYIVFRGEYVYYLPGGPTFAEAKDAGSAKRKAYGKKCFETMLKSSMLIVIFMIISMFFRLAGLYDWIVAGACIVAALVAGAKDKKVCFSEERKDMTE